jgi:putative ATP-binding cassette transporter
MRTCPSFPSIINAVLAFSALKEVKAFSITSSLGAIRNSTSLHSGTSDHLDYISERQQPPQLKFLALRSVASHLDNASTESASLAPGDGDKNNKKSWDLSAFVRIVSWIVVFQICLAVGFEVRHRSWADVDFDQMPSVTTAGGSPRQDSALWMMFSGLPQLARPYFSSTDGRKGSAYVTVIICLGIAGLFFSYVLNMWQKAFWDLFQSRNSEEFVPTLLGFVVIITALVLNDVYSQYVRAMLYIHWRTFMTNNLLDQWLRGHVHFFMHLTGNSSERIDNPDQRIQEDVHLFVEGSLSIGYELLSAIGHLLIFVPIVLMTSPTRAFGAVVLPGWLLYMAIGYSLIGTFITHFIGRQLINLSFARQRYEADFRHLAVHVRDHSESITVYESEASEAERMRASFENIKVVWWQYMMYQKRLSFWTVGYSQTQWLVPFFILAPSYFAKDISMGDLFQLTGALARVCTSLDWFINVYPQLTSFRATANRLLAFEKRMAQAQKHAKSACGHCRFDDVTTSAPPNMEGREEEPVLRARFGKVTTPAGMVLWSNVGIEVKQGQGVLISGSEGAGKSVLLKALAGVWPFTDAADVQIAACDRSDMLFVPQRPVLPHRCSLRQALAYPELGEAYGSTQLREALEAVELFGLLCSPGSDQGDGAAGSNGLETVREWGTCLSPGQQQRIAVAHVLLKKPRLLFLDEATSNVGKEGAIALYKVMRRSLPEGAAVVSISHDVDTLLPLHDVHYIACDCAVADSTSSAGKELRRRPIAAA